MSNWSSVIITWSGIDELPPTGIGSIDESGRQLDRLVDIEKAYCKIIRDSWGPNVQWGKRWVVSWACPDQRAIGGACEFLATTHYESFDPDGFLEAARQFQWSNPEEVQIFFKDEDMERYASAWRSPLR